ncbi:MAG: hypothetical protein EVG15_07160 [Candidatus Acididesulfobacter diazotrophicus]|uniref:Uncharacterized protein n=1 Tax=Candidatus Acididesulfobacter diazotrophicus TaxID=2597226 RepID=A0A519BLS5_9DELT|nr:MAG: hypothetical protein EVG15_07160 [Candidatus Acididesulfobacter diazotrophicus]
MNYMSIICMIVRYYKGLQGKIILKNIPHSSIIGIFLSRFSSANNINLMHNTMQNIAIKAIHKSKSTEITLI